MKNFSATRIKRPRSKEESIIKDRKQMTALLAIFIINKTAPESKAGISFDSKLKIAEITGRTAQLSGLKPGDTILEINETPVSTKEECLEIIKSNTELVFKISRPTDNSSYDVLKIIKSDPTEKTGLFLNDGPNGLASAADVRPGSLASNAGLKAGDLIVGVGDILLRRGKDQFIELIKEASGEVLVTVSRCIVTMFQLLVKEEFLSPRVAKLEAKGNEALMACCCPGVATVYMYHLTLRNSDDGIYVKDLQVGNYQRKQAAQGWIAGEIQERLNNVTQRANIIYNKLSKNQQQAPEPMVVAERVEVANEASVDVATQLSKIKDLLDSGVLSQEEFEAAKAKILA
eukprot:CAMPEP_0116014686 /NCGR_PEP_ID=MMETSP0321-20121206/6403_1 /TAXON_ID=163516 /ORGANISM="Leptocylindrus danicus var. danicus, Strain B650" /LENGTH=344 /DNA_ID=CAMNT_0003484341 /DNA_START=472 /DNA_END=1506 /DNA_ORIENTATION=-